jgi:ring-1,2-phenylacetyl-CoA epoxidase subunit PaaC
VSSITITDALTRYLVRHADDNLIIGQRLAGYISEAPELEEDLAIGNISLDHIGVAMHLYRHAATLGDASVTADKLAFLRTEREFFNALLVEQPHDGFGDVIARQFFFAAYQTLLWEALAGSTDTTLAGIAAKALKEATYHLRHAASWVVRLGDGTDESHRRMQASIDRLWRFTGELFESDEVVREMVISGAGVDPVALQARWEAKVAAVLEEATLMRPTDPYQATGGRSGMHTEHLGYMLAEMQWMQRTFPDMEW